MTLSECDSLNKCRIDSLLSQFIFDMSLIDLILIDIFDDNENHTIRTTKFLPRERKRRVIPTIE